MGQAGPERHGVGARPRRRGRAWGLSVVLALVAVGVGAVLVARPWEQVPPTMRPAQAPERERSVSVDLDVVTDPATDWSAVAGRLDQVGATGVHLSAGRVEFTAFDWSAHPDDAAEPGTDHLARAARALHRSADGTPRQVGLIVDAFVPEWIAAEPELAGVAVDGTRARYQASATALASGPVGDRLVAYVAALGERYDPAQVSVTELFLSRYTFGTEDLALFREMTGAQDWPRDADGRIDEQSPQIGAWRSDVLAGVLGRMRDALDATRDGQGAQIELAADVRVDWDDPAAGVPSSGHDYRTLLSAADRLTAWAYVGARDRTPRDVERFTARLRDAGYDPRRFTLSVGLWAGSADADPPRAISPELLARAVDAAASNGVEDVNVTPLSHLSDAHWEALASVWAP